MKSSQQWQKRLMGFFHAQLSIRKMKLKPGKTTLIRKRKIDQIYTISVDSPISKEKKKMKMMKMMKTSQIECVDNQICVDSPILKKIKTSNSSLNGSVIMNKNNWTCSYNPTTDKPNIDDLPEHVLSVILIKLPLKYLLRCRSVQKSWYSLVRSSNFITLHLNYQKKIINTHNHHHPKYLFFRNEFSCVLTIRFDDIQCEQYCGLRLPPGLPDPVWFAQSHGLICLTSMYDPTLGYQPKIYLWNPLVRKYKTLPDSPLPRFHCYVTWTALAFGFIPQVNDFVVVQIVKLPVNSGPDPHSVIIGVYSLNTNSWRITSQDNVFINDIRTHHHVFVNGVAYWLGIKRRRKRQIIMCFDTNINILREISLPQWVRTQRTLPNKIIHPFGQSIAYFVEDKNLNHFDMWVLKVDPVNEFSWEKKMSVRLSEDIRPEVLGLRNNGEPIVFRLSNLISYNLDTHEANDFVHSWVRWDHFYSYVEDLAPPFGITPFVESLVLLDSENEQNIKSEALLVDTDSE